MKIAYRHLGVLVLDPTIAGVFGVDVSDRMITLGQEWAASLARDAPWVTPTLDKFLSSLVCQDMSLGIGQHVEAVKVADIVFMNNYLFSDTAPGELTSLNGKMAKNLGQWLVKRHAVLVATAMLSDDALLLAGNLDFPMGSFSWQTSDKWKGYIYTHK